MILFFFLYSASTPTFAWNAAGHRLVAIIAWRQFGPLTRAASLELLRQHPDFERWQRRAKSNDGDLLLAEAATWADDIRNDPRFYDGTSEAPTPPLPGQADTEKHKSWHYMDLDAKGNVKGGEIEVQIERLTSLLRCTSRNGQQPEILPWLAHLVADIHQPLHVGRQGDDGGNAVEIENPYNPRQTFTNLHTFWDDLPGAPWLRGKRLREQADLLLAQHEAPRPGKVRDWRNESHALLNQAYPSESGSLLPLVTAGFRDTALGITQQRLVAAGYRLGKLLEQALGHCGKPGSE